MNDWPTTNQTAATGRYRTSVDAFEVEELLGYPLAGDGEHLYLHIEKRGLTTRDVQLALADGFAVPEVDVGFAGMKDKHAVTRQWFSVRAPARDDFEPANVSLRVLERTRHTHKLRRGALCGNRFVIRLDDLHGDLAEPPRDAAGAVVVPNYFGPQRFGFDGGNISAGVEWLTAGRPRIGRFRRGLHLSALRSFLFNEVLAARVAAASWCVPIAGDVIVAGRPTGPLWGRGRNPSAEAAGTIETAALAPHRVIADGLEFVGLRQDRRALALEVQDYQIDRNGSSATLRFFLARGGYATSVLAELGRLEDATQLQAAESA